MDIVESVKMAVTTLTANKLRSSLTMLGIIIGNASVISMIGIGEGAQTYIAGQVNSLGSNLLFIIPGSPDAQSRPVIPPQTLVLDDAEAIASQVPSVEQVAPTLNDSQLVTYRNKNVSSSIVGTTPEFLSVRSFDIAQGRFLNKLDLERQENVVALGSEAAEQLFGNTQPVGQYVRIKNSTFQVIGVMQGKGSSF